MAGSMGMRCGSSTAAAGRSGWLGRFVERGRDDGFDAAAHGEVAGDRHAPWVNGGHQVVQNLIGYRLVKDAAVAEVGDVVLQRFQLDTVIARHVVNADLTEVRQAGFGAERGEFRTVDRDLELAFRPRAGERLDRWHA